MRWKKCTSCRCKSCLNTCARCTACNGLVADCKKYNAFWQTSIFDMVARRRRRQKKISVAAPRKTWEEYGISKQRYGELMTLIRSGGYARVVRSEARRASETLSEYIYLSLTEKRSYEGVEYAQGLGRIPCGRTDFYGYRRLAVAYFNEEMRRIGI